MECPGLLQKLREASHFAALDFQRPLQFRVAGAKPLHFGGGVVDFVPKELNVDVVGGAH